VSIPENWGRGGTADDGGLGGASVLEAETFDDLRERLSRICASAVDPLEIASALEFEGVNDAVVQERFGRRDVFALAEELYGAAPRRPFEPADPTDPWQFSRFRPLLHALLYGLPAVCFLAGRGLLTGAGVVPVLVVALVVAWSLSQAVAYLGYLRLGTSGRDRAKTTLRLAAVVALVVVIVADIVVAVVTGARLSVVLFGVGEGVYMVAAAVILVLEDGWALFLALEPGVLAGAFLLGFGSTSGLEHLTWAMLAIVPMLALGLAADATRGGAKAGRRTVSPREVVRALPTSAFGLFAAGLLVFPVVAGVDGRGGPNPGAIAAALPIALSMGAAEALLLAYRRASARMLRRSGDPRAFSRAVRLILLAAVLTYAATAAALIVLAVAIGNATALVSWSPSMLPQLFSYLLLGAAMYLALTMQAFGLRGFTVGCCALALGGEIAFKDHGIPAQLMTCGALFVAVGAFALVRLSATVRHG
jgi:hypothetical protein